MIKWTLSLILFTAIASAQPGDSDAATAPGSKYYLENLVLKNIPNKNRVVLMGDSITEFWKANDSDLFAGDYINRGISGETTNQMLQRFNNDVIALHPKAVVIMGGTNDIAQNGGLITLEAILTNIAAMAKMAQQNKIRVVLCSVLPAQDFSWHPGLHPIEKIAKLNSMIQSYALKNKFVYIDYYAATVDAQKGLKVQYTQDGVHPNKQGYEVMKPLLKAGIAKTLKGKK